MNAARWVLLGSCLLGLAGCEVEEIEREIGYQGAARRNPWLAAERLVARYGYPVESLTAWRPPEPRDAVWLVPASVLGNESFVRRAEDWMRAGGHLVLLLERAGVETSDWRDFGREPEPKPALANLLRRAGIALADRAENGGFQSPQAVQLDGESFQVAAGAARPLRINDESPKVLVSQCVGDGRLSAVADARMFRNRWIAEQEHAELLMALIAATDPEGSVVFVRAASQSLGGLVRQHLWAVLCGLAVWLALWLWRSLSRFGPLEAAAAPEPARGYDHHLAALGNFHWQHDRAAELLAPLREQFGDKGPRGGGRTAADLHPWLAARCGLPLARVARALDPAPPADGMALTRIAADLQILLQQASQPPPHHD